MRVPSDRYLPYTSMVLVMRIRHPFLETHNLLIYIDDEMETVGR